MLIFPGAVYHFPGPLGVHGIVLNTSQRSFGTLPNPAIPRFRSRAFPNISPEQFYLSLVERYYAPEKLNQRQTGLCLTTAFFFILANTKNSIFWNYAWSMYETGESSIGNLKISPGSDCKNIVLGSLGESKRMNEADWVILASFRDSMNWIWDVDDEDDGFPASGTAGELYDWFNDCGLFSDAQRSDCDGEDAETELSLQLANSLIDRGYWIAPRINADLLSGKFGGGSKSPNHRVVATSRFEPVGDNVRVEIFSWGEKKKYFFPRSVLLRHYFGFVAALP